MKFENNWKNKSLESLEKHIWSDLNSDKQSYLIITCNKLRKKPLIEFTVEDMRIMIGQDIGLKFLIPLAIDKLREDILAEGDCYKGDLLKNVLRSDKKYWINEKENWEQITKLFNLNKQPLKEFETTWEIRKEIFDAFKEFETYLS
jgi:hypothetical protein